MMLPADPNTPVMLVGAKCDGKVDCIGKAVTHRSAAATKWKRVEEEVSEAEAHAFTNEMGLQ